jgi:hypothetical protein
VTVTGKERRPKLAVTVRAWSMLTSQVVSVSQSSTPVHPAKREVGLGNAVSSLLKYWRQGIDTRIADG